MFVDYQARNKEGALIEGVLELASLVDARRQLRRDGLFPVRLTEATARSATVTTRGERVPLADLLTMTTELSIMLQSGLDLAVAIRDIADQSPPGPLKNSLIRVEESLQAGLSFSVALQRQSGSFGDVFAATVASGEASGTLPTVLRKLRDLLENEVRLRTTIRGVLAYPLVLTVVASIVMLCMFFFVLPQFGKVFESIDAQPPWGTRVLLSTGEFVRGYWLAIAVIGVAAAVAAGYYARSAPARQLFDRLVLQLRGIRGPTRSLLAGRAFRLLGTMLQSGVPLIEALHLTRRAMSNVVFRQLIDDMDHEVNHGRGISSTLRGSPYLPRGAAQMVSAGERSGTLGDVLTTLGEHYEAEGERQLRQLTKIAEPIIIVVLGVVVGAIVLAIIVPLVELSSTSTYK